MSVGTVISSERDFEESSVFINERIEEKLKQIGRGLRFAIDVLALFRYMSDPGVHWAKKSLVVAALLYFIIPVDSIPDFAPVVGYLDDIGVVGAVVRYLGSQLKPYYFS
ncbi:MAG: DUF1232 domain-containing protein [Ignavibacteriales bacterium]|nr:DUF1232 domain-containing protein [Ignavibacteriales bacterium]